jgi:hypothetical protein
LYDVKGVLGDNVDGRFKRRPSIFDKRSNIIEHQHEHQTKKTKNRTEKNVWKISITHVILTGGVGSRLWPLSRKSQPKQYLDIF